MSSVFGENLKLSIFGQSHGKAVGMVLDGIPAGLPVDAQQLQAFLNRRRPGQSNLATRRNETDRPEFLSGIVNGRTCGAPIAAVIENADCRSADYAAFSDTPRPGHADMTAQIKYGGFQDGRGGGHFSGRLTAPMCIAGGLCLQWLETMGIRIGAHIIQIGSEKSALFNRTNPEIGKIGRIFPTLSADAAELFRSVIEKAAAQGDSVGGRIECAVTGLPAGLGEPMFGGVENRLSQILYAIPGVKNVGFGDSERLAGTFGSESNDPFTVCDGRICTETNTCGGILGGITNGMPLIFDLTVKPTPSIAKPQQTVSLRRMENTTLSVSGRHDACIALRAVPVAEGAAAIAIYDLLLSSTQKP